MEEAGLHRVETTSVVLDDLAVEPPCFGETHEGYCLRRLVARCFSKQMGLHFDLLQACQVAGGGGTEAMAATGDQCDLALQGTEI